MCSVVLCCALLYEYSCRLRNPMTAWPGRGRQPGSRTTARTSQGGWHADTRPATHFHSVLNVQLCGWFVLQIGILVAIDLTDKFCCAKCKLPWILTSGLTCNNIIEKCLHLHKVLWNILVTTPSYDTHCIIRCRISIKSYLRFQSHYLYGEENWGDSNQFKQ